MSAKPRWPCANSAAPASPGYDKDCSRLDPLLLSASLESIGGMFMAFCGACGAEVSGAAFCPKCGAAQGAAAPAVASNAAPTEGLEENIAGLLCYAFGWVSGLIFLLIDKRPAIKFH